ncbi:MAG: DUF3566 domain-containing protein [Tessaracoccus sp.]
MSDAPRWPGPEGKPGLVFEPEDSSTPRTPKSSDGASQAKGDATSSSKDGVTRATTPSGNTPPRPRKPRNKRPQNRQSGNAANTKPQGQQSSSRPETKKPESQPAGGAESAKPASQPSGRPDFEESRTEETEKIPTYATSSAGSKPTPPKSGIAAAVAAAAKRKPASTAESKTPREPQKVRRTRKARLRLARIDPWSVMKTSFLFSIAFGVMLVVAVFALWSVLASTGAIESANSFINQLIGDGDQQFNLEDYLSISRIMGLTVVIAAIDVVILTALATLLSFLYNLAATVLGGIEVTLAED